MSNFDFPPDILMVLASFMEYIHAEALVDSNGELSPEVHCSKMLLDTLKQAVAETAEMPTTAELSHYLGSDIARYMATGKLSDKLKHGKEL